MPESRSVARAVLDSTPTFLKMFLRWTLTVFLLMLKFSEISALETPSEIIILIISISFFVSL